MGSLLSKEVLVPIRGAFALVEDEYTRVSSIKKLLGHTHLLTHSPTQCLDTSFYRIPKKNIIKLSITIFQEKSEKLTYISMGYKMLSFSSGVLGRHFKL